MADTDLQHLDKRPFGLEHLAVDGRRTPCLGVPLQVQALEEELAAAFGRRRCVLTGNGTTALHLLFRALSPAPRRVLLPALLCRAPLYAAVAAGVTPAFCDVSPATLGLDAAKAPLAEDEAPTAILAAHAFGVPLAKGEMLDLACRSHAVLVEDAAQGGWWDAPPPGSVTVLSFGAGKPLDVGGGGALLTDEDALADAVLTLRDRLPPVPPSTANVAASCQAGVIPPPESWLRPVPVARLGAIRNALRMWPSVAYARARQAAIYARLLAGRASLQLPTGPPRPVWAYTVLLPSPGVRSRVLILMRKRGLDAWPMYQPLHEWWRTAAPGQPPAHLPVAEEIASRALNLPVDPRITDAAVQAHAEGLLAALEEADTP